MSYYENNAQWSSPSQNNWEHQAPPSRTSASGPTSQDEFAFFYQFEEVDRGYENLAKSGKTYAAGGRREYPNPGSKHGTNVPKISPEFNGRMGTGAGSRPHSVNSYDDPRGGHPGSNLQNFYATQRHQSSRGSNDAEQMMQAKRRMAAQRERELRNLHTEQQYQRTAVADLPYAGKGMSEEETRDLIARQRSALYGEGPFADKGGYVDENGTVRTGVPVHSGPSSLRGPSPMTFDPVRGGPPANADANTPGSATEGPQGSNAVPGGDHGSRTGSTASPQPNPSNNKNAFESAVSQAAARTTSSSPGGSPPRQELPTGAKASQPNATVAPIGTRPSGGPGTASSGKRSTTPLASPGGWGRGNGVWGQSSGLSATSASVWG